MARRRPIPEGYDLLPKARMLNLQIKGKGVMPESPEKEDWRAIFAALNNDGYEGKIGLETHLFDGTLITAAHKSMDEIMKIVRECLTMQKELCDRVRHWPGHHRARGGRHLLHAARRPD